jgi:hypothetical protein
MKGQISFVEYVVSFAVFTVFSMYLFFRLLAYMPTYLDELDREKVRSQAYQLSEFLTNDPGFPIDWETGAGPVQRIGLSSVENKSGLISANKVLKMGDYCSNSNYGFVKSKMGVDFQFSVRVLDEGGPLPVGVVAICDPPSASVGSVNATVSRVVAFDNGNYGELIVNVW